MAVIEQVFGCIGACGLGQDIKTCNIDCLCGSFSNGYFFLKYLRIAGMIIRVNEVFGKVSAIVSLDTNTIRVVGIIYRSSAIRNRVEPIPVVVCIIINCAGSECVCTLSLYLLVKKLRRKM